MRRRRRWVTAMLATAIVGSDGAVQAQSPVPAPAMWQGYATAAIARHARQVGGQAPREQRRTCEGDVNGDGRGDVAVVYRIEGAGGGAAWTQYLIVLTSTPDGFGATAPKEIGGTGKRSVESCTVATRVIDAAMKEFVPGDPACCPSKPGQLRLTLEKGKLTEAPVPAPSGP